MKTKGQKTIAVLGAGIMGHGIAQVFALKGYKVNLLDTNQDILDKALERVKLDLEMLRKRGKIKNTSVEGTLANIRKTTDLAKAVKGVVFVVEAIPENIALKKDLFQELDRICAPDVIFSSNTSTMKITEISSATKRPDKVIGMHWMLPPHLRPLVEVIPGEKTSKETIAYTKELAVKLGKTPVEAKDSPGFIINRLQIGVFLQALKLLEEGVSPEDIDRAWTHHLGLRYCIMGPIEAMDSMGLDTLYMASLYLASVLNDPNLNPPDIVKKKFEQGEYGYKTGKGFYDYTNISIDTLIDQRNEQLLDVMDMLKISAD